MTAKSIRKLVVLLAAAALWAAGCAGDGSTGGVTAVAPVEPDAAAHGDAAAPPTGGQPTGQPREDAGAPGEDEGAPSPDEGTGEPVEPGGDGLDELRVDALVPAKGSASGQETVTIFGSGFVEGARVLFDESDVQSVFVLGKDRINVTTPPHAPGLVRVTVILPDERSYGLDDAFLYFNAVRVDELDPPGGPAAGGTPIRVRGTGFAPGSRLVIGQSLALNVEVVDDSTILALTPGGTPGEADVFVSNSLGLARKKNGFLYTAPPAVRTVVPGAGPADGGTRIEVRGEGFFEPLKVRFGSNPAPDVEVINEGLFRVVSPPGSPGAVDLRVQSPYGTTLAPRAFVYTAEVSEQLTILNVAPDRGSVLGGTEVVVTATSVGTGLDSFVRFGGVPGETVSTDEVAGSVTVKAPPADEAGVVDVTLQVPAGTTTRSAGFAYEADMVVAEVEPNHGPTGGGTTIVIRGAGFEDGAGVFVDALPALEVDVKSATTITAVTPEGSPGFADVKVVVGARQSILEGGFFYTSGETDLYVVTPDKGAVAGGTFVHILGAGFAEDSEVTVGGSPASHVTFVDPTHLTARTPPGEIGTVSVEVEGSTGSALLESAYTYFDPTSAYGGTWGEEVEIAVNVTVLDGSNGEPIPDAFVMLGSDPKTPYQGFTNLEGQVTFSGPDLSGPQMVSVSKEGYENNSVVAFDAENVTIYLVSVSMAMGPPPPGITPPIVKGRVFGLGKYVVGPPGNCWQFSTTDPSHCDDCEEDSDCGDLGARCLELGQRNGKVCAMQCTVDGDCPENNVCRGFGQSSHCIPGPGHKVAVCIGTIPHIFAQDVNPGTGAMVDELGEYSIIAYPGNSAIVCLGGFYETYGGAPPTATELVEEVMAPSGAFVPVAMGVVRNQIFMPGEVYQHPPSGSGGEGSGGSGDPELPGHDIPGGGGEELPAPTVEDRGVDVTLNIPLTREIKIRLDDPPIEDTDFLGALIYLDLGADGVFRMPASPFAFGDDTLIVEAQPERFAGDIEDASYTIMAGAFSFGFDDNLPMSIVLRRKVKETEDDRMLRFVDGTWELKHTGLKRNVLGAFEAGPGRTFTVGTDGTIYHYNGATYAQQASDTSQTLRAIHGSGPDDVWAVGDNGTIRHFNGVKWERESADTFSDLRAVYTPGGGVVFAAGNYVVRERSAAGDWSPVPGVYSAFSGMHGTGPEDVWMVGSFGAVYRFDGEGWSRQTVPTVKNLRAVLALAEDDVWLAGEGGALMHFDGETFELVEPLTERTLTALAARGPDEIYAVGSRSTVLRYDGEVWAKVEVEGYRQTLNAVIASTDSTEVHTFGDHELFLGPMVPIPHFEVPADGGTLDRNMLRWSADTRVEPHFQMLSMVVPGFFGDTPVWSFIAAGDVRDVPLPDFPRIEGTPGIPEGPLSLTIMRAYKEGFDIDHFDYSDLSPFDWQAWAIDVIPFVRVAQ